jgi:hypothetical protein
MFNQNYLEERFDSRVRYGDAAQPVNEMQTQGAVEILKTIAAADPAAIPEITLSKGTGQQRSSETRQSSLTPLGTRLKTQQAVSFDAFKARISGISAKDKQAAFKTITDRYGVLAAIPYSYLDEQQAAGIVWEKAGELVIDPGEDFAAVHLFKITHLQVFDMPENPSSYIGHAFPDSCVVHVLEKRNERA